MSYVLGLPFMSFSPFFPCVAEVWEMISWKIIASMCCMLPLLQCLTYIISNNPFSHTCCGCLYHHLQRRNLWCIEVKWLAHSLADGLWQNQCSPLFPCDSVMHSLDWSLTIYYDLNFCRSWTFRGFSQKLSNLFTDDSHTTFFFLKTFLVWGSKNMTPIFKQIWKSVLPGHHLGNNNKKICLPCLKVMSLVKMNAYSFWVV